jgi:hypothetical protein
MFVAFDGAYVTLRAFVTYAAAGHFRGDRRGFIVRVPKKETEAVPFAIRF